MSEGEGAGTHTVASQLSGYLRAGGIITPLLTALIAFFIGGLVVALTGANPFTTYKAIFEGSGLNWLLPWISSEDRTLAALNLQQTLILTTPLILTGLAVAYAFRAGLFNIGGQGQYFGGLYIGVVVGSSFEGLPGWLHILLALVLGTLAGALWGGIAGVLKATTGANEVITTIMLNYVALWIGVWAFGLGGPLHSDAASDKSVPISNAVVPDARLHVFWGDPELQGLHVGIFLALAAASLGFLVFNWPPAKIFMGDVGSTYLGYVLAAVALVTIAEGRLGLAQWAILAAAFVTDASVTLIRRLLRGERIAEAHRLHAYQALSRRWGGHLPVTVGFSVLNIVWLLPLAWLAAVPGWAIGAVCAAYLPLIALALVSGSGAPETAVSRK